MYRLKKLLEYQAVLSTVVREWECWIHPRVKIRGFLLDPP